MFEYDRFTKDGFIIIEDDEIQDRISGLKYKFENSFLDTAGKPSMNRAKIGLFAKSIAVSDFINGVCTNNIMPFDNPVYSGRCVTHYTSNNSTGNSFGLGWHQDYPSMASSKKSIIMWTSLTGCGLDTHGLELIQGSHKNGLYSGEISQHGYLVDEKNLPDLPRVVPLLTKGGIIIFSSFLVHRTHVNPEYKGHKIAFSQRFDDMDDQAWADRGYPTAYNISVDRELYKQQ